MKTNAIIRIVLYSLAILLLLGILLAGLGIGGIVTNFGSFIANFEENDLTVGSEVGRGSVSAEDIQKIQIEWVAGSITIQPGDTDVITFSESDVSDEKYQLVWKQTGNTLTIQYCQSASYFGGFTIKGTVSKNLVITVPREWSLGALEIDAASARVTVSDMRIAEVDFDGASGVCEFINCRVGELDLDTASGDIRFTGTLNTLECDAASASCTIVLENTPDRIDMDSMSGDLILTLPADAGFTASIETLSGHFSSDFTTTLQNGAHVSGDGSCRINISGLSGDVTIRMAK